MIKTNSSNSFPCVIAIITYLFRLYNKNIIKLFFKKTIINEGTLNKKTNSLCINKGNWDKVCPIYRVKGEK